MGFSSLAIVYDGSFDAARSLPELTSVASVELRQAGERDTANALAAACQAQQIRALAISHRDLDTALGFDAALVVARRGCAHRLIAGQLDQLKLRGLAANDSALELLTCPEEALSLLERVNVPVADGLLRRQLDIWAKSDFDSQASLEYVAQSDAERFVDHVLVDGRVVGSLERSQSPSCQSIELCCPANLSTARRRGLEHLSARTAQALGLQRGIVCLGWRVSDRHNEALVQVCPTPSLAADGIVGRVLRASGLDVSSFVQKWHQPIRNLSLHASSLDSAAASAF